MAEFAGFATWRTEASKLIPAGTFVWLEDLRKAWAAFASEDRTTFIDERPGDRELDLNFVETPAEHAFTFEGFPRSEAEPSAWPFTHDTRLLGMVRWVIQTYWEDKDPKMWPNKELVVEKLKEWHGLTQNEAEAADLVTRHDSKRRSSPKVPPKKISKNKV